MDMSQFSSSFKACVYKVQRALDDRKAGKPFSTYSKPLRDEVKRKIELSRRSADMWIKLIEKLDVSNDLRSHVARTVWWDYCKHMSYEDNRKFDRFQHRYLIEDPPEDVAKCLNRIGYTPHEAYLRAKLPHKTHKTREEHPDDARSRNESD